MKQEHAELLAVALAAQQHKPSLAERRDDGERSVPKLHKNTLAFEPVMLKSALFRPASGARAMFATYTAIRSHGAHLVEYQGEELRQDDLRVLLVLLKERSGQRVDNVQVFVPRTFCREVLNWADSSDSVAKLRACIERLHGGRVRISYADGGLGLYSFVFDAHLAGEKWSVWLSERLATMFERSTTYIPQGERQALRDGLVSWLFGFVKADACFAPFSLAELRDLSGSTSYVQKAFNRILKAALEQLQAADLIDGFELTAGKVRIRK
jgi:hypothetical protein